MVAIKLLETIAFISAGLPRKIFMSLAMRGRKMKRKMLTLVRAHLKPTFNLDIIKKGETDMHKC